MDFKEATDRLFDRIDHADLANKLGVSVATIRQARLDASAKAHRTPPQKWEDAAVSLAKLKIDQYRSLIDALSAASEASSQRAAQ